MFKKQKDMNVLMFLKNFFKNPALFLKKKILIGTCTKLVVLLKILKSRSPSDLMFRAMVLQILSMIEG